MRIPLICAVAAALGGQAMLLAQAPASYRIFRADGSPATVEEILARAKQAEVVFLGESHDDPTAHLLELDLLKRLHAQGPAMLSLEMFESDIQYVLDEYLAGLIPEEQLITSGRAWKNYKADYRPMVEFAKEQHLPVVAANAPRRYVNRVSRLGAASLTELPATAKAFLPPLPYGEASEAYAAKFNEFLRKMKEEAAKAPPTKDAGPERKMDPVKGLAAQSLWDANMAYSLAQALMRYPARTAVQVNGSFHSEKRLGILDHLARYRPSTRTLVVTMLSPKGFPAWEAEFANAGDFVILTDPVRPKAK